MRRKSVANNEWGAVVVMSSLEMIAVVTSILGIWLTSRLSLYCWPVVLASCGLYGAVFAQSKLYSDMLLQGVFALFTLYGWWSWSRGLAQEGAIVVRKVSWRGILWSAVFGGIASLIVGALMARFTNASLPHVDSTLSSFSLVAQFWATKKYLENWFLWIAIDVLYIGLFIFKHLYLTSGLYAVLVVLAVLGLRRWYRSFAKDQTDVRSSCTAEPSLD